MLSTCNGFAAVREEPKITIINNNDDVNVILKNKVGGDANCACDLLVQGT